MIPDSVFKDYRVFVTDRIKLRNVKKDDSKEKYLISSGN